MRKVIAGGPAAFSCELAVGDILLKVDGVTVTHETPDEVARRIVGPEGVPITVTLRMRRTLRGEPQWREDTVTLLRQPTIPFPERLSEANVGLGIDIARVDGGGLQVRRLQSGAAAQLSGKLKVGDVILEIDGNDVRSMSSNVDVGPLLVGPPFSRVCLVVVSDRQQREIYMVRSVLLMGEFHMRHTAYRNQMKHAIVQPAAPGQGAASQRAASRERDPRLEQAFPATVGSASRSGAAGGYGDMRSGGASPSIGTGSASPMAWLHDSAGSGSGSEDGVSSMMSRSSTASRDSIAQVVRQQFGEQVDSIRTVDGREATFRDGVWPHAHNPRLAKAKMAVAGFLYTGDREVPDKVMCAYCGLELGHWEPEDDPWMAHHEASPGCSFWRKSAGGERLSKEMYSGYGSPYHSMFRTVGMEHTSTVA